MPGRKRRLSNYMSASLKRTKNIHTRRSRVAVANRDLARTSSQTKNKRLKKG